MSNDNRQDGAEPSPASTGSGSRLPTSASRDEWLEKSRGVLFFGVPVHELGREDLLAVVGYLMDQTERERKHHASTVDFLKAASR